MNVKSKNTPQPWSDPDDAPELTDEFFEKGVWRIGDKVVTREETSIEDKKRRGPARGRSYQDQHYYSL